MRLHEVDRQQLEALLNTPDPARLTGALYGAPRGYSVTCAGDPKRRWTVMLELMTKWLQRRYVERIDPAPWIGAARRAK